MFPFFLSVFVCVGLTLIVLGVSKPQLRQIAEIVALVMHRPLVLFKGPNLTIVVKCRKSPVGSNLHRACDANWND